VGATFPGVARFPLADSLRGYERSWLGPDAMAGLVLAALLVPQGMAYAEVAGMPPVNGLYATVVGLAVFAIFGGNRNLVLGPDSSSAALVFAILTPLAAAGTGRYVALGGLLALMAGALFVLARVARLSFLSDFLAGPIIIGYQAGLGVIIIVGQIPKLLGFSVSAPTTLGQMGQIVRSLDEVVPLAAALGLGSLAVILVLNRIAARVPGLLLVVAGGIVLAWGLGLVDHGVRIVGDVPSGLPPVGMPGVGPGDLLALLPGALTIWIVTFTDTVVESRVSASRGCFDVDVNMDMVGVGLSDVAIGLASGFPISASGSRTVVVQSAGGRTQAANLLAAGIVAAVLVLAAGPLKYVPQPVLGAVVVSAAVWLVNVAGLQRLFRWRRSEFWVAVTTLVSVVVLGVIYGILIAVSLALLNFVRRSTRPHATILGRVDGRDGYHSVERHPEAGTDAGILVYRFDAPLFFANASYFAEQVKRLVGGEAEAPVRWVVLDASTITDIDTSAAGVLSDLVDDLAAARVTLALADAPGRIDDHLRRYGLTEKIAPELLFDTIEEAVAAAQAAIRAETEDGGDDVAS